MQYAQDAAEYLLCNQSVMQSTASKPSELKHAIPSVQPLTCNSISKNLFLVIFSDQQCSMLLCAMQSIASKLREPEHATPSILEDIKDRIKDQPQDQSQDQTKSQTHQDGAQQKKSGPNEQQERLTEKIMSEGMEKLNRRPEAKQTEVKAGTPTQVQKYPLLHYLSSDQIADQ